MPLDLQLFGNRLREIRKDRELTQVQLAACLGAANGWISELENARQRHIESNTIYRFCEALQVSADYLMGLSDVPGPLVATQPPRRARRRRQAAAAEAEEAQGWEKVGAGGAP